MYQAFEQAADDAKTVLIVEDQLEMRAINAMYLHHHGYRVVAADNGVDGLKAARETHPDLILMDISVPGIDGIRATEVLKSDPATGRIPVVILTAHPYGSVGKRAVDA
ncbi:MAG TPA: response regulator, partial [Longimicrobium sp.]|nr:response regulator [Longimicrobium sp.]